MLPLSPLHYRGVSVQSRHFDGHRDDLATGGLGADGLASSTPPFFADPVAPTPAELRRRAIYENYRSLADTSREGGYGQFFGPGVPVRPGAPRPSERIAGLELTTTGPRGETLLLQVPDRFDPDHGCLVLVPPSASRGIYGGIALAEWALKQGFAVACTDKGAGTGFHNLDPDLAIGRDGMPGGEGGFRAPDDPESLARYRAAHPHRIACKHAHSGEHCEASWGEQVLESARFGLEMLGALYGKQVRPTVIASGISNGGGASLRAAELDREGLIHAVAVSEPQITPTFEASFRIRQGERVLERHSQSLLEYASLVNLYQPAANLAGELAEAPLNANPCADRAAELVRLGLLKADDPGGEALARLEEQGLWSEQNRLGPAHASFGLAEAMSLNMAQAYGRFMVSDGLAGYSYAAVDPVTGRPVELAPDKQASLFCCSNGIPPTGGLALIDDRAAGGPIESRRSRAQNVAGALELRALATGVDPVSGEPLTGRLAEQSARIRQGMEEIKATGDLGGRPAIIVNGRCDAVLAPNHSSRSYVGKNLVTEGQSSGLRYYEVTRAHHLDALNGLPELAAHYVPLAPYLVEALNLVHDSLLSNQALPPSQVIRARERGTRPLSREHLPPISPEPGPGDRIRLEGPDLIVPD